MRFPNSNVRMRTASRKSFVKPKSSDMTLEFFGLIWLPYRRDARGQLAPDWQ